MSTVELKTESQQIDFYADYSYFLDRYVLMTKWFYVFRCLLTFLIFYFRLT